MSDVQTNNKLHCRRFVMNAYRWSLRFALFVVLFSYDSAKGQTTRPITLDSIKQAWRDREEKYQTVMFVCEGQLFFGKEDPKRFPLLANKRLLIPKDHSFAAKCFFALDGDKMTYKQWGMLFNAETQKWDPAYEIYAFDGEVSKSLRPADENNLHFPQGMVYRGKYNEAAVNTAYCRPILFNFRPLHPVFGTHLDHYRISGKSGLIDGRKCVLLEWQQANYRVSTLWLDPGRGFLFMRYSSRYKGNTDHKLDVHYSELRKGEWLPIGWDIRWYRPDGTLHESFSGKVTQWSTGERMDPSEFRLDFPRGTWVTDRRNDSELGKYTEYIILPNGQHRVITRKDLGKKYEEILAESGGWFTWPAALVLVAIIVTGLALLGLALLVWKKWLVMRVARNL
jgi:hypothetical protein